MGGDVYALLGGTPNQAGDTVKPPQKKRRLLKPWDLCPAQLHNSSRPSAIEKAALLNLWKAMSEGHKSCEFCTEYADPEELRQGIATSRLASSGKQAIERLKEPLTKKVIIPEMLKKATDEAEPLYQALCVLDGAANKSDKLTMSTLGTADAVVKENDEVTAAAKVVYKWMQLESSILRSLMQFLGGGAVYYNFQCFENVGRADIKHGGNTEISEEHSCSCAVARLCTQKGLAVANELSALS